MTTYLQLVGGLAEPFNGFQFFQIPSRRVIEDQFPAVALLEQFPLLRLHLGKLLMDSLVLVVLRPFLSVYLYRKKSGRQRSSP